MVFYIYDSANLIRSITLGLLDHLRHFRPLSQSGMAYATILILLAILAALGFSFIFKVGAGTSTSENRFAGMQAQYLAEAAANHAMWRLLYESPFTCSIRVSQDDDDAEEQDDGIMKLDSNNLELGKQRFVGVRFLNVTIPQGAKIVSAYVSFLASTASNQDVNLTIYGQDADNAAGFTSTNNDISNMPKTTASTTWEIVTAWKNNNTYKSPDLKSIIQEIVDRPGWSSGNSMAILFQSDVFDEERRAVSHDQNAGQAPVLYVGYGDVTPANENLYYMNSFAGGRYGYKIRYHTDTTFATVATVGAVGDDVVHQSYVLYVIPSIWYDPAWLFRQKITILSTVTDTNLTDFPYLIKINDPTNELFVNAQTDGDDILFTASDGTTKLEHEIEKYDSAGNALWAWVKIPLLSSTDPTVIYMYYNNPTASNQENPKDVWSNGYKAVYHLHDDFNDSLNQHNGTNNGSADATGQIADAQDFYPSFGVDSIDLGNWNVSGNQLTIQAWIKSDDNFSQNDPRVISKANGTAEQSHVWMMSLYNSYYTENRLRFRLKTGNFDGWGTTTLYGSYPNGYLPDGWTWYLVAMTYDGSQMRIIRDGLDAGSVAKSGNLRINNWDINIGNNPGNWNRYAYSWDGKIDEVRISSTARSLDWMKTEYRNQSSPGTYQTIGAPETRGGS